MSRAVMSCGDSLALGTTLILDIVRFYMRSNAMSSTVITCQERKNPGDEARARIKRLLRRGFDFDY
jgi:hypothetical protein